MLCSVLHCIQLFPNPQPLFLNWRPQNRDK